jgi:PAS domain S-box-containing protein
MEDRLTESEQQLRIIFDHTGTANSIFDTECRLVRQNQLSVAALGISEDQARGLGVRALFGEARGAEVEARMRRVLETRVPEVFETEFQLLTGAKTFRSAYQPLLDGTRVVGIQLISQDITEQVRAQKALRESEAQFRTIFELAADVVCIAGLDGVFRLVNPAGRALLQYPEEVLYSTRFLDFVVPEDREATQRVIEDQLARGQVVLQFENRYRCADGQIVFLEWVARPVNDEGLIFAVARNTTERQRFEADRRAMDEQIRKTQKLESLGILAGGIAHDFNNLLAGILGFADLAALHAEDDRQKRYLDKVVAGCHRAQALTRQLLTFSKGGTPVTQPTDLGALVEAAVPFASHGSTAQVSVRVEPGLPLVDCDPEQLGQVVSNLVINAIQAMEQGGTLDVAVEAGWGQPPGAPAPVPGVVCRFTDSGPGIPESLLDRIFDPFSPPRSRGAAWAYRSATRSSGTTGAPSPLPPNPAGGRRSRSGSRRPGVFPPPGHLRRSRPTGGPEGPWSSTTRNRSGRWWQNC